MRPIRRTWLILLALFALIGEPIAADAHLSIDSDVAGICSASSRFTSPSDGKTQGHQHRHSHDCCVAVAALATTAASEFNWQPDWFSFEAPALRSIGAAPALSWQLRRSRAPPSVLV